MTTNAPILIWISLILSMIVATTSLINIIKLRRHGKKLEAIKEKSFGDCFGCEYPIDDLMTEILQFQRGYHTRIIVIIVAFILLLIATIIRLFISL